MRRRFTFTTRLPSAADCTWDVWCPAFPASPPCAKPPRCPCTWPTEPLPFSSYAPRLLDLREGDVCALSHYGVNFLGERAARFADPDRDMWWLFPVFQVSWGEYRWPERHVNLDQATDLLLGAAVASAYDDILHGTGPLTFEHLPRALFEDRGEGAALDKVLKDSTGLDLGWGRA